MDDFCLMNRIAWNETIECKVFKTYYKTALGDWTEQKELGNWQRWNNLPDGCLCCDVRYEKYYVVDGLRYDNVIEAKNAMLQYLFGSEYNDKT